MIRRSKPLKRAARVRPVRSGGPRRGRVVDRGFMEACRAGGCLIAGKRHHRCLAPMTFHHIREFGGPKDDTWGVGLCAAAHLVTFNSRDSIEALGKPKFEEYWGVNLVAEAQKNRVKLLGKRDGGERELSAIPDHTR